MVREESARRRAEDRAARGQGPRRVLRRARPDRVHHGRLHRSARRPRELEQHRAMGAQGLDPRRQDLRHPAGGLHRRALLQQGHAEAARRRACPRTGSSRRRSSSTSSRKRAPRDDAHLAGRGRPSVPGRLHHGGSAAAQARTRRLSEALHRQAVVRRSARRRGSQMGQGARGRRRLSEELHDVEARRDRTITSTASPAR